MRRVITQAVVRGVYAAPEGKELRLWLYDELTRRRIRTDDKLWRRIRALAKAEVHAVEELPSFLRTIKTRALAFG